MARNTSLISGDNFAEPVDEQMQTGYCNSTSKAARAGLKLLEEQCAKACALQQALIAGEQSGEPSPFDFATFKARKRADLEAHEPHA